MLTPSGTIRGYHSSTTVLTLGAMTPSRTASAIRLLPSGPAERAAARECSTQAGNPDLYPGSSKSPSLSYLGFPEAPLGRLSNVVDERARKRLKPTPPMTAKAARHRHSECCSPAR